MIVSTPVLLNRIVCPVPVLLASGRYTLKPALADMLMIRVAKSTLADVSIGQLSVTSAVIVSSL